MKPRLLLALSLGICLLACCRAHATSVDAGAQTAVKETSSRPAANAAAETLSWNRKPFAGGADNLRFAVVADNTGGLRPGVFKDALGKVNLLRPELVMCVGDLIEGYEEDEAIMKAQWDAWAQEAAVLDAPFFGTVGNHDVSNDKMTTYVQGRYGPVFYSFSYKDVLFIVLNSQDDPARDDAYRSGLSQPQVEFVKQTLADNPNPRWTFVFMHQPLFVKDGDYAAAPGWSEVEAMLAPKPHTVFAGHWHEYAKHVVNGHDYYRLGTTGGASELRGAERGELDHIVWVTVTPSGPVVVNLDLKGIYADDVATEQTAAAYDAVDSGGFLKLPSLVTDQNPFSGTNRVVVLANKTDFPLSVKANITSTGGLVVVPASIDAVVAPRTADSVDISITAPTPVASDALEPCTVEWTASYDAPGRKPIEGTGKGIIVVEGMHTCRRAVAPVKVDGDLSEWGELPLRMTAPAEFARNGQLWQGPADTSMAIGACYDDKHVYLAFAVTDDKVVVDDAHNARQEDALSVLLDARPAALRNVPAKDWQGAMFLILSPGREAGKYELGDKLPEGTVAESVVTPTGYATEIAIPRELFDKAAGGEWKDFRLNVRLHDLDTSQFDNTQMWWRPSWIGPLNYAGSGTFRRE